MNFHSQEYVLRLWKGGWKMVLIPLKLSDLKNHSYYIDITFAYHSPEVISLHLAGLIIKQEHIKSKN